MVLNTEWTQLETIILLNESNSACLSNKNIVNNALDRNTANANLGTGGGFGFGITGNKSTGVVVKAITFGGSAYKVSIIFLNQISWFFIYQNYKDLSNK